LTVGAVLSLTISVVNAGDQPQLDVARITSGLRVDASVVVREDLTTFEVFDRRRAEETHTVAYSIFRPEGRDWGEIELPYNRFRKIDDLRGGIYDGQGKEVRTLSDDDVKDESDISAYSLYEDARIRKAEMYYDRYPYTVMFTYRIVYDGFLNFPSWHAQSTGAPVEHTRFEVILPAGQELRYWTSSDSLAPRVTVVDGGRHYLWEASGLKELSKEELDEDIEVRTAEVRIAPREFELEGHRGAMTDWKAFGAWCASLYHGKLQLPPDAIRDVDSLVAGVNEPREKAERLYRYLQRRTRYVNVTLGIGGWEPYDATYVHQRGYGDCKALSNYMVALLARAGIRSAPVVIYAGGARSRTIVGFSENRFNHVIVCMPLVRDTVWLECTSQTYPFGHLGDFTENRPALLITPEGGVMVRTPFSPPERNVVRRKGRVVLSNLGDARGEFSIWRTGNPADAVRGVMTYSSLRDREQWILRDLDVNGTSLGAYTVKGVEEHADDVSLTMDVNMPHFAASTGSRLFFVPDVAHRNAVPPKYPSMRKSPVRLSYTFVSTDSIRYVLPGGFGCEALPAPVNLDAPFGRFSSSLMATGDTTLLYVRSLEIRTAWIRPESSQEYVKFMNELVKADKAQVVVVRRKK
jgi:hypothetical protein